MLIKFEVVPYALFDTLKALSNTKDSNRFVKFGVTKEDDKIVVWAEEIYHTTANPSTSRNDYVEDRFGEKKTPSVFIDKSIGFNSDNHRVIIDAGNKE